MLRRFVFVALLTLCAAGVALCAAGAATAGEIVEKDSKQSFPDPIQIEQDGATTDLRATGAALRKKFFFKVYAAVGYVDASVDLGDDPGAAIVAAESPKQIHLRMLRDVDSEKITNGVNEALEKCAVVPLENLAAQREAFLGVFGDEELKKGADLRFTYLPGQGLEVTLDGEERGLIEGDDFARSFFAIYFGDPPVDDGMKEKLLSNLH